MKTYKDFLHRLPGTGVPIDGDQWIDLIRWLKATRVDNTQLYAYFFADTHGEKFAHVFDGPFWRRDIEIIRASLEKFCSTSQLPLPDYVETPLTPSHFCVVNQGVLIPLCGVEGALPQRDFDPFSEPQVSRRRETKIPSRLGLVSLGRRPGRAFTLLEMVVSLLFFGILMTFMLNWVLTLGNIGNAVSVGNYSSQSSVQLKTQLGEDLTGAVVCQPNGLGVPYYTFSSTEVGLFEPGGGEDNLVLWQYANNEIERATITPSATCVFDTSDPKWQIVASGVQSAQFVPAFRGSSASAPAESMPNCTGAPETPTAPENCWFDSVTLEATLSYTQGENTGSYTLNQAWSVSLSGSELGGASASESATVPESPSEVVAGSYVSGESTVSWNAPANGGSAITGFTLQYSSDGGQTWTTVPATIDQSPYTVTVLTDGSNYVFEVAATNSLGTGPWSGPSAPATPCTAPGGPGDVVAGTVESGQAPVSWVAPSDDGGSPIVGYRIRYSSDGGSTWTTISTANGAVGDAVTGLSDGTTYEFEVAAINGAGPGSFTQAGT
jgi:hypothetical protein